MKKIIDIKVQPAFVNDDSYINTRIRKKLRLPENTRYKFRLQKKSIDARGKSPLFLLRCEIFIDEPFPEQKNYLSEIKTITRGQRVLVVGAGPAGYFAGLKLLELGLVPVILDRGKDVQTRRRDLRAIQQFGEVNSHSNYCFGEGGAGTYSDGKLYTRSHKRGNIIEVLQLLVEHGAKTDILTDAHPHIGSNKLPKIVSAIRESIEKFGGEVYFNSFVTDIQIKNGSIEGVVTSTGKEYKGEALILATGHSARDIYYLLDRKGISLEKKSFALGVRIEHPQELIDQIQYGQRKREENLPAASYSIACQIDDKGVFSFCMCPGGLIVPTATAPGEIVVNGMSLSRRDSPFANSGFVTAIDVEEMEKFGYRGLWAHLDFQKEVEQRMFNYGDGSQKAPAQRITDFVQNRISETLPSTSYIPGIYSAPMQELLPDFVSKRLKKALIIFGKKLKGYFTEEAQIIGVESRTSSPIRIPRNAQDFQHPEVNGLFPCGEGAGYAGGILSAALDGQNVAKAVSRYLKK